MESPGRRECAGYGASISVSYTHLDVYKRQGYADLSGNILLSAGSVYIYEKGNPNKFSKKKEIGNIFYASSTKTLLILRKMLEDTGRAWKIKDLATEAGCSIGMVSRVKEKLCEQLWAEMTSEGLKLIDSRGLLDAWSQIYTQSTAKMITCYTTVSYTHL